MKPFKLEEYLTQYEFSSPYLLCCSDAESFALQEILKMADQEDQKLWNQLQLNYTEPYGSHFLRHQIASSFYPTLKTENILCFVGAEEGIFASLHVLCDPSDHVIVLTPCYQSLFEVPFSKGADISQVLLQKENEWKINIDNIKKVIKPNTKCVIINFPHNPTGQVITTKDLTNLISLCDQHGLWLFSDEVYRLLGTPNEPWSLPAASLYPKAISLGVMSKSFSMAGLRIGWIACQDTKIIQKIKQMKDYLSICNSAPAEVLSFIAIKNKEKILNRNNQIVFNNLNLLDEFFKEYDHLFQWVRPQGGCVGFVHYQGSETTDQFCQRLVQEKGVLLLPSSVYNADNQYFRIGFGRQNMPDSLNKFKEFLET